MNRPACHVERERNIKSHTIAARLYNTATQPILRVAQDDTL